ncbi:uncharacterized protein [Leptinotarsa decemlineata]|uniref:uncharacterized protein n=1 Tax=Leptinotarsa decemlineata TaxID=7539 RepID=UPI003D309564
MCCKCPPLPTGSLYIRLNIIFGIFSYISSGVYITGPVDIQIISISKCPGFEDEDIHLQFEVDRSSQTISGNISLETEFDHLVKLNLRDKSNLKYPKRTLRSFINQTSFCKIIDNYLSTDEDYDYAESGSKESICPVSQGIYTVKAATAKFTVEFLPYEMLGTKRYQMKLIRNGKLLICRELEVVAHQEDI